MPKLGVIFDMDGVLVDSYQAHFVSWSRLYDELGVPYSETDFAADFGRTSRDILRRRFGEDFPLEEIRKLDERKEALFREVLQDSFPTMDGAVELIDSLAADGFLMAVGSSGPPENIALCLEKLGRRDAFAARGDRRRCVARQAGPAGFRIGCQSTRLAGRLVCGG